MWMLFLQRKVFEDNKPLDRARVKNEVCAEPDTRDHARGRVRVFLHPGRRRIGDMDAMQLCEQFDVDWSRPFDGVTEAERACADVTGFLIEVVEPFVDRKGGHHQGGALFAKGLR